MERYKGFFFITINVKQRFYSTLKNVQKYSFVWKACNETNVGSTKNV